VATENNKKMKTIKEEEKLMSCGGGAYGKKEQQ